MAGKKITNEKKGKTKNSVFPFSAIVGQGDMKLALLLNVIDPTVGGVVIMGHRGTGKSTAVRALADLLPQISRVKGCAFGCDPEDAEAHCDECRDRDLDGQRLPTEKSSVPVVNLPLGATEDRVCGSLNVEKALSEGIRAFEPGLLARANRGFLYIDEVNLLEDHLIDVLLDVAVTGRNTVEREGMSLEHPARFVLVGSGNPEEGELRPQLLDRFGLHVMITTEEDLDSRVAIVEARDGFTSDPTAFLMKFKSAQEQLRRRLRRASTLLPEVSVSRDILRNIAGLCARLRIDGHRGEITITRAARALAAFEGRRVVTEDDVRRVATMSLRHRLRRDPLDPTDGGERVEQALDTVFETPGIDDGNALTMKEGDEPGANGGRAPMRSRAKSHAAPRASPGVAPNSNGGPNGQSELDDRTRISAPPRLGYRISDGLGDAFSSQMERRSSRDLNISRASRRKSSGSSSSSDTHGRYVRAVTHRTVSRRLAIDATLRAAALEQATLQSSLGTGHGGRRFVAKSALRYKRFSRRRGKLYIIAVDTSGSMAIDRLSHAKGALQDLLRKSYVNRDRVALISFGGDGASVIMPPGGSVTRAGRLLDSLAVGGSTPLPAALQRAAAVASRASQGGVENIELLLFTDGRANVPLTSCDDGDIVSRRRLIETEIESAGESLRRLGVSIAVVDTQNRFTSPGEGTALATRLGAQYLYLSPLSSLSSLSWRDS